MTQTLTFNQAKNAELQFRIANLLMQKSILSIEASPKTFDLIFDKLQFRMQSCLDDAFESEKVVSDGVNSKGHEGHSAPTLHNYHLNTFRSSDDSKLLGKQELRVNDNVTVRGPLLQQRPASSRQLTSECEISSGASFESAIDRVEKLTLHNRTSEEFGIKTNNLRQLDIDGSRLSQDVDDRYMNDTNLTKEVILKSYLKYELYEEPAKEFSTNAILEESSRLSIKSISEFEFSILKKNQMQGIASPCLKSSSDSCITSDKAIMNKCRRNVVKFKEEEQNQAFQGRQEIIEKMQPVRNFECSKNDQYDSDASIDICELYERPKRRDMYSSFESSLSDMWRSSLSDFDSFFKDK